MLIGVRAMAELSPEEVRRRDCLARHLLSKWTRQEIVEWLDRPKQRGAFREDMRDRLNRIKQEIRNQ